MFFKLRNIIEDTKLFILFESGVFGDSIANRKLGFTDKDIQVTLIPKIYYVKSESAFNAFSENGRLDIAYIKTPLKENQLQACDLQCSHLVKSIRIPEHQNQGPCYVKGTTLHNKALKVHESEIKEAIFTKKTFKIRFTIWGDMSRIENPKILRLFKQLMNFSSQHYAYSVNPPKILKSLVMKSVTTSHEAIESMNQGYSCYLGNKEFYDHGLLKYASGKPLIQCFSLGDGDPLLPTCSSCKTPCSGHGSFCPHTILASNKERSSIYVTARKKTISNIYDVIKLTEEL